MPALVDLGTKLSETYRSASPFPHIVIREFFKLEAMRALAAEAKAFGGWDGEKDHFGSRLKRFCFTYGKLPPLTRQLIDRCNSPEFLAFLEALTGETGLVADPDLVGGGIHSISRGGFLKVHADFNWHPQLRMYRRLNLLLYLNEGWKEAWGGGLELWSRDMGRCEVKVTPELGTMVIFTTDDSSFHGHPEPMTCPVEVTRDSIALYYYSPARSEDEARRLRGDTDYRPRTEGDLTR